MGFNGVRKHQKIERPALPLLGRRLGLLVWEEMPSAYRFTRESIAAADARVDRGDRARHLSHPCIVAWVPFNESWGVPDLPAIAAQRHYVAGALPPDEDARSHAAGGRQRRLGERRHRHHRHPRLRCRRRAPGPPLRARRDGAAAVQARPSGRADADGRRPPIRRPAGDAHRVRRHQARAPGPRLGLLGGSRLRRAVSRASPTCSRP